MTEEPLTKFIDRVAYARPEHISRDDLLRYLKEPALGQGITRSVKAALRQFVESHK